MRKWVIELSRPGFIEDCLEMETSNLIEVGSNDGFGFMVDTIGLEKVPNEVEILCDDGCGVSYRIEPLGFYRDLL